MSRQESFATMKDGYIEQRARRYFEKGKWFIAMCSKVKELKELLREANGLFSVGSKLKDLKELLKEANG